MLPIPRAPIGAALKVIGKAEIWDRLAGELVANPGKLMRAGWQPNIRSAEGLAAMMRADRDAASPARSWFQELSTAPDRSGRS